MVARLVIVAGVAGVACVASASPRPPHAPDPALAVRRAYVAARTECERPAGLLAGLVVQSFSATGFGEAVADDWRRRSDHERHALEVLADRVVGDPIRATAIKQLCAGSEIESARVHGEGVWITVLVHQDHDACNPQRQHLLFHSENNDWIYDGEWFCGVMPPRRDAWRRRYGTDYEHAMAILACEPERVDVRYGEQLGDPHRLRARAMRSDGPARS